jgi:hypothetical protein
MDQHGITVPGINEPDCKWGVAEGVRDPKPLPPRYKRGGTGKP